MVEVEALGHHLRAHEDVDGALREAGEDAVERLSSAHGILVHAGDARFGEDLSELLLDLLRAEADHAQSVAAALAALHRRRVVPSAVMAAQLMQLLVVGEAHIAVVAMGHPGAALALPYGHVAAPVLEEDGLLALLQRSVDGIDERLAEVPAHLPPARSIAQINNGDRRHGHIAEAGEQFGISVLPAARVVQALQAGCGAAEQGLGAMNASEHDGHVARVVAGRWFMLFIAGVVLLVHHHQLQIAVGEEEGGACSNDDGCRIVPLRHAHPELRALMRRHAAVVHGDPLAEAGAQPLDDLRRKGDLRQQVEHLPAAGHGFIDERAVHLGLAR